MIVNVTEISNDYHIDYDYINDIDYDVDYNNYY